MKPHNKKEYNKHDAIRNGFKTQNQHSKNEISQSIEPNALNDSGLEAKKKGY
ncbi:hypothetical protein [Desnuesiella massiliensis]|uniref:hypothetical protein n=1 Tax=Desnuesiella massiliensis TaxID=1650662 RepID=UPI0018A807A8|nr:hypothetical protein [Desnuesiella massiliensis]